MGRRGKRRVDPPTHYSTKHTRNPCYNYYTYNYLAYREEEEERGRKK